MKDLKLWARSVLGLVAAVGAVLSYASLYKAAQPTFHDPLAYGFPLLVDALILGASLQYIAGARVGRPRAGWRLTAHAGVAGTITLNALAAPTITAVPWHVTAPIVWSVLVELTARDVLGEWKAKHRPMLDHVPLRLWLSAPIESGRTWLRMARRVEGEQADARLDVGAHGAALEALRIALPGRSGARARRILQRQLRAGSLSPEAVLRACGWDADTADKRTVQQVLQSALGAAIGLPAQRPAPEPDVTPEPAEVLVTVIEPSPARTAAHRAVAAACEPPKRKVTAPARVRAKSQAAKRSERLTYEQAMQKVQAAIDAGELPSAPSENQIRSLGFGAGRAKQIAAELANGATS